MDVAAQVVADAAVAAGVAVLRRARMVLMPLPALVVMPRLLVVAAADAVVAVAVVAASQTRLDRRQRHPQFLLLPRFRGWCTLKRTAKINPEQRLAT